MTPEQKRALEAQPDVLVELVDEAKTRTWYLIPAEKLQAIKYLLTEEEFNPREFYPQFAKTAAAAGWADPRMDVYDDYEPDSPESTAR